jgi:hypothetical protein
MRPADALPRPAHARAPPTAHCVAAAGPRHLLARRPPGPGPGIATPGVLVLVVHRHDRHLHLCLSGVQENRERWTSLATCLEQRNRSWRWRRCRRSPRSDWTRRSAVTPKQECRARPGSTGRMPATVAKALACPSRGRRCRLPLPVALDLHRRQATATLGRGRSGPRPGGGVDGVAVPLRRGTRPAAGVPAEAMTTARAASWVGQTCSSAKMLPSGSLNQATLP